MSSPKQLASQRELHLICITIKMSGFNIKPESGKFNHISSKYSKYKPIIYENIMNTVLGPVDSIIKKATSDGTINVPHSISTPTTIEISIKYL